VRPTVRGYARDRVSEIRVRMILRETLRVRRIHIYKALYYVRPTARGYARDRESKIHEYEIHYARPTVRRESDVYDLNTSQRRRVSLVQRDRRGGYLRDRRYAVSQSG